MRPTPVFSPQENEHKLGQVHEKRGAVASNSWGGSGVSEFSEMVEGLDQRRPTNLSVFTKELDNIRRYRSSARLDV